jgi:ligand-binding sensor domain-containing protein
MSNTHIVCAARDRQGNLWFGTYGEGAFRYTGKEWHNFTPGNTGNGLPGMAIKDILVDNQDNLWFATVGNVGQRTAPIDYGVTRYNGTDWASFLGRTDVETIFQDSDGNMWFGTNVGVTRYDGSNWQTFTTEDGLADNYVVAISQDNQGNMWFGTWADGVSRYDGKNWRTFTPEDGLVSDAIHCMLKDSRENLWFGSYSIHGYYGISRFNGTQWQNFDPWQGKDHYHYNVISIFQDNEGNLWFATSFGLVRYNPG